MFLNKFNSIVIKALVWSQFVSYLYKQLKYKLKIFEKNLTISICLVQTAKLVFCI